MPAGHSDLLDGFYGDWREDLRGLEENGFVGQIVWE
jgi:hypothetical protein